MVQNTGTNRKGYGNKLLLVTNFLREMYFHKSQYNIFSTHKTLQFFFWNISYHLGDNFKTRFQLPKAFLYKKVSFTKQRRLWVDLPTL